LKRAGLFEFKGTWRDPQTSNLRSMRAGFKPAPTNCEPNYSELFPPAPIFIPYSEFRNPHSAFAFLCPQHPPFPSERILTFFSALSLRSLAPLHFPEIRSMFIAWRPCPARGQSRGSRHDEARILSSVRAESARGCADGPARTAPLCGREAIFHRNFATRRSCLPTTALSPGHKKRHLNRGQVEKSVDRDSKGFLR
jgi:hypothetical protein